uniref:Uncharacterized protein n=1 Tax=Cyprinodon variegatus TaxID=28743 RepID=A0A3Q2D681_CYPVA
MSLLWRSLRANRMFLHRTLCWPPCSATLHNVSFPIFTLFTKDSCLLHVAENSTGLTRLNREKLQYSILVLSCIYFFDVECTLHPHIDIYYYVVPAEGL